LSFEVTYVTSGPVLTRDDVASWLTEHGEPWDPEGDEGLVLRALPVRLDVGTTIRAAIAVTPAAPLVRVVDVLFALSMRAGADLLLGGKRLPQRGDLWLLLADEQDRKRIVQAIERADLHGHREELQHRLWSLLGAMAPGRQLRWDATEGRVMEVFESEGEQLRTAPVADNVHIVVWRWISDGWPGLAEP
jgi:hypothetical protein